jgi:hypothetical protein
MHMPAWVVELIHTIFDAIGYPGSVPPWHP